MLSCRHWGLSQASDGNMCMKKTHTLQSNIHTQMMTLLHSLGFSINVRKSLLSCSQMILYIRACIDTQRTCLYPPEYRCLPLNNILSGGGRTDGPQMKMLLGLMASCTGLVSHERLRLRPLKMCRANQWTQVSKEWDGTITITKGMVTFLHGWTLSYNLLHLHKGKS